MCVICVCINRGLTESEIKASFMRNDHGAGLSWFVTTSVGEFKKGFMDVNSLIDFYYSNHINEKLPHVVHFRKSSCSGVAPVVTHPFIVSPMSPPYMSFKTNKPLLYHNGTIPQWKEKMLNFFMHNKLKVPDGLFSDSRFMAVLVNYLGKNVLKYTDGKFVLFNCNKKVLTFGKYIADDGVLFSNNTYKNASISYSSGGLLSNAGNRNATSRLESLKTRSSIWIDD
jgi:hypothetical protein